MTQLPYEYIQSREPGPETPSPGPLFICSVIVGRTAQRNQPRRKRVNGRGECLMTTIYQYFTDKLGAAPADDTLRQLPINSETSGRPSGSADVRIWHETVMAVQSPHVCCRGQSGRHLLGMSISHFAE